MSHGKRATSFWIWCRRHKAHRICRAHRRAWADYASAAANGFGKRATVSNFSRHCWRRLLGKADEQDRDDIYRHAAHDYRTAADERGDAKGLQHFLQFPIVHINRHTMGCRVEQRLGLVSGGVRLQPAYDCVRVFRLWSLTNATPKTAAAQGHHG